MSRECTRTSIALPTGSKLFVSSGDTIALGSNFVTLAAVFPRERVAATEFLVGKRLRGTSAHAIRQTDHESTTRP